MLATFLRYLSACLLERSAVYVQLPPTCLGKLLPLHIRHHHRVPGLQRVPAEAVWSPPLWGLDEDRFSWRISRVGYAGPVYLHLPRERPCQLLQVLQRGSDLNNKTSNDSTLNQNTLNPCSLNLKYLCNNRCCLLIILAFFISTAKLFTSHYIKSKTCTSLKYNQF